MNPRFKKFVWLVAVVALLVASSQVQKSLNRDRDILGMTYASPLDNAPPLLAFTTVALGGFRGLISNFLWIRANDLQQDDKFFEAAQLANWITDLEPHFTQVWIYQGWNMAYNISVKFKDFADRWRWVENGINLLRDQGLRYNPDDVLIYRELAWFFQHKMGQNMDDANLYYKREWAKEMEPLFGAGGTNYAALVNPQTSQDRTNAFLLRTRYKMDPNFVQKVDSAWGPFDWRLSEAHAIYWGAYGLDEAKRHPDKVKADDEITLRRIIYQSLYQAFKHGRIIANPFNQTYSLGPNLALIPKVNDAYLTMFAEETQYGQKVGILNAHRNFLRDAVYFLYENNEVTEATKWYKLLSDKYPEKAILDEDPTSFPKTLTLDEYAVRRVQEEVGDTSEERTTAVVQGLLMRGYSELAIGQDDRYAGFKLLAGKVYQHYNDRTKGHGNEQRVPLPPFNEINHSVLNDLLNPANGAPYAARATIRTYLGMPAETNAPAVISTNLPAAIVPSNTPAATNSATP